MKVNEKKDWAKTLFLRENITQKEISQKVDVSEKTISKWVTVGKWDKLRQSIFLTKEEQLRSLYMQLEEQNIAIMKRPEGGRFANSKEADARLKTIDSINRLETESNLTDVIEVCQKVVNWLRPVDLEKAKEATAIFDAFIRDNLKK